VYGTAVVFIQEVGGRDSMKDRRMARDKHDVTLIYRAHTCKPEDFLHFVEYPAFSSDWDELGLDVEEDLLALQLMIMANPSGAPVITGTGGLRKLRFAPSRWNCGKSGAARVCYVFFKEHWTVVLLLAYGKGSKETLTNSEKAIINSVIRWTEKWLNARSY